ncbi:PE-PGRS virulence associated protein [Streptomyces venezuelae]|nr:PE-PGRS virulence associated protein [Streptomyces venezuelae]
MRGARQEGGAGGAGGGAAAGGAGGSAGAGRRVQRVCGGERAGEGAGTGVLNLRASGPGTYPRLGGRRPPQRAEAREARKGRAVRGARQEGGAGGAGGGAAAGGAGGSTGAGRRVQRVCGGERAGPRAAAGVLSRWAVGQWASGLLGLWAL